MSLISKLWQKKNGLSIILIPFSYIYRCVIYLRRLAFQVNIFSIARPKVPIIIVGNITVGGSGKTPLVIHLANMLMKNGYSVGVISRGYKAKNKHFPTLVKENSNPIQYGDEPVMIARRTGVPVVIDPNRPRGVEYLVEEHQCNIIISDDGLQHYALARDIEIAVVDGKYRYGNQHCLPAGPLREPISRLSEVDWVVANGQAKANEVLMEMSLGEPVNLVDKSAKRFDCFAQQSIAAIAGIGHPEKFFSALCENDIRFRPYVFSDHHNYKKLDLISIKEDIIFMTEKDAVKVQLFAQKNYWYIPLTATLPKTFDEAVLAKLGKTVTA